MEPADTDAVNKTILELVSTLCTVLTASIK